MVLFTTNPQPVLMNHTLISRKHRYTIPKSIFTVQCPNYIYYSKA